MSSRFVLRREGSQDIVYLTTPVGYVVVGELVESLRELTELAGQVQVTRAREGTVSAERLHRLVNSCRVVIPGGGAFCGQPSPCPLHGDGS